jgi:hypothetical protein
MAAAGEEAGRVGDTARQKKSELAVLHEEDVRSEGGWVGASPLPLVLTTAAGTGAKAVAQTLKQTQAQTVVGEREETAVYLHMLIAQFVAAKESEIMILFKLKEKEKRERKEREEDFAGVCVCVCVCISTLLSRPTYLSYYPVSYCPRGAAALLDLRKMLSKTTEQFTSLWASLQYLQTKVSEEAKAFRQKSLLLL